jgi:hypothetical protein
MNHFIPDVFAERRCMDYLRDGRDYHLWPVEDLKYMFNARGGGEIAKWIDTRAGWFRPGGPASEIKNQLI